MKQQLLEKELREARSIISRIGIMKAEARRKGFINGFIQGVIVTALVMLFYTLIKLIP